MQIGVHKRRITEESISAIYLYITLGEQKPINTNIYRQWLRSQERQTIVTVAFKIVLVSLKDLFAFKEELTNNAPIEYAS